ncbi:MAG: ANTAR domain-containing protein [Acidimicrobiia bacterium]
MSGALPHPFKDPEVPGDMLFRWFQAEERLYPVAMVMPERYEAAVKLVGRLAEQLRAALEHRSRIERAKGILMVRERIDDAAAFERLRSAARSSRRPLIDVVNEVLGGQRLSRARG